MANKEMKTIQFPNSEIVYEIVDNAAREALAGKQPSGNYATTEALNAHTDNTNNPHSVTKTQLGLENVANERQYSSQNPPPYPVSSVAGKTGIVTLNKSDVSLGNVDNTADMDKPVSTAQAEAINAKYTKPASGIPKTDLAADMQTSLGKADSAYQKPSTGIPKADLSEEVQNALETAAQGAPDATTTIKGIMTLGADGGAARYGEKSDVGLENVDNVKQYSASNPPPYPVTSVAGRTGAVTLTKADVGLSNVDNTSDTAKPVSTAQATAIAEAKQAGTNAQNAIDTHAGNTSNPHNVTAAQVGAYVKPASGIPETDLSAEVQEKLNAGGGGGATAENLLQSSVTANRQAGVAEGDMVNLGYSLGLEEGKMYTVKYRFNDADIVATAKYEAPMGSMLEGATLALCQSVSAEGETMAMPMLLGVQDYNASVEDYQTAALNYGYLFIVDKHQITGDQTYSDDENNSSVYPRALQSANAQNAVSVEITSIEPFAEVVADKVKNALTIGDVVFDGSSAKTVDLSEYAKTTGTYSDMSVGNSTNLIPDSNGAVNPNGRGSGTVGANSTALGTNATASKDNSTALGSSASAGEPASTALGNGASAVGNSSTALGNGASAGAYGSTALGYAASVDISSENTIQLGSSELSALRCQVNLTVTSDERDKADINNIINALPFLEKLNPVTFVSNDRVNYISEADKKSEKFRKYGMCDYDRVAHALGTKKGERRRCGLLAQEVIAAMQEVYGTDNYANIVNDNFHDLQEKPTDVENKYTLAYANLVPFLIGAIKELNAKIEKLEDRNNV